MGRWRLYKFVSDLLRFSNKEILFKFRIFCNKMHFFFFFYYYTSDNLTLLFYISDL